MSLVLQPTIYDVMDEIRQLLETNRTDMDEHLAGYAPDGIQEIYIGHRKSIPQWPVIEILPRSVDYPWFAQRTMDYNHSVTIFCGISMPAIRPRVSEDAPTDLGSSLNPQLKYLSILEACVRTVLTQPANLQFTIGSTGYSIYNSKAISVAVGTLNLGSMLAAEIAWFGRYLVTSTS